MCGRYSLFAPPGDVEERFDATFDYDFEPRYNAAPRQALPVITSEDPGAIQRMEWGLVPSWADDRSDFGFINARAETVEEKASFGDAYERRRCLVPADGFYEWTETESGKQPYRVERTDGSLFAMAGLYERWEPPQRQTGLGEFGGGSGGDDAGGSGDVVETFTIVTTEPSDDVAPLHHRMAVVLAESEEETWLHGDPAARRELLRPYPGDLSARPVSRAVNDPGNDSPSVLAPPG
ncbi:SOS response-associated peptidase [Halomicrobium salinisoli]|uniref:SOS response-associated peptidase n=1 Tax=Halomicrobium salinisoli TaxID=2878391 RepID=UPI001CEFCDC8|nr:SOS response-associated peptidase [Halomicrobium salinisoli]